MKLRRDGCWQKAGWKEMIDDVVNDVLKKMM
jgi:hypothetical protein